MADYISCLQWVLKFEDSTLSGRVVVLNDGAGRTRFGISEKNNSSLPQDFYTCSTAQALTYAESIYRISYWNPMMGDLLTSDELAATLLSFGVNDGIHTAIKLLQECLDVTPDGGMGPITLAAANSTPTAAASLRQAQAAKYKAIALANPAMKIYEEGWLRRANAVYPIS